MAQRLPLTKAYLGDGLYAAYNGFQVILMANGVGADATDTIYLDRDTMISLQQWIASGHRDHTTGLNFLQTQERFANAGNTEKQQVQRTDEGET